MVRLQRQSRLPRLGHNERIDIIAKSILSRGQFP
ncbi:hypothetical protein AGR1C_Cc40137 [Agrobacterium fabacearum TT111]|nr:hypothetical protein AGR1C_Cc40137 [Agrobacterium fabacearum TT111]